jgi:peroxiredoxin Q/BCP
MLTIGIKAPDFKLRLDSGEIFRLRDLQGKNNVVITFFPHDFEKTELRETYLFLKKLQNIQEGGTVVITISPKNTDKLREFFGLYNFTLPIATDATLEVCRNYRAVWLRGLALRKIKKA